MGKSSFFIWLENGYQLINDIKRISPEEFDKAEKLLKRIQDKYRITFSFDLFIVVNEGMHPIKPKLKEQFGNQITVEVLTKGNVDLNAEREIARKCKALAEKYHDYQIYLVPSGFPYLAVAAYNVLQQTLARHPIWLQFDRESKKYLEKNLDPRSLLNGE